MTKERHSTIAAYIAENQDNFVLDNGTKVYGVQILPFEVLYEYDINKVIVGFCVPGENYLYYPCWRENGCKPDGSQGLFIKTEETSFVPFRAIDNSSKELCEAGKLFLYRDFITSYDIVQFIQHVPNTLYYIGWIKETDQSTEIDFIPFVCNQKELFIKETVTTNKPFDPPF